MTEREGHASSRVSAGKAVRESSVPESEPIPGEAPVWEALPAPLRERLARVGMDSRWYERQDEGLRLTALVLCEAMHVCGLWDFVRSESGSTLGCLHFCCTDVLGLQAWLRASARFSSPRLRGAAWQARERRVLGALHLKHFASWPEERLQAHIDPVGLWWPWWGWLVLPGLGAALALLHGLDAEGYRDLRALQASFEWGEEGSMVQRFRDVLLALRRT